MSWSRRIAVIIIAVAFGLWDAAVIPWFPWPLSAIKLTLPFVAVLAVFSRYERAVTAAIAGGIVLDVFLASNAGLVSIRYLLIALVVSSLRRHVFTDRSLIGVSVLGALSVLADRIFLFFLEAIQSLLGRVVIPEEPAAFWASLCWTIAVMVTMFFLFTAFGKRFLPLVSQRSG